MKLVVAVALGTSLCLGTLGCSSKSQLTYRHGDPGVQPVRSEAPVAAIKVPPGHMPPPGQCRIWYPGTPPGRQPKPVACSEIDAVPAGAMVLSRTGPDRVRVLEYHASQPGVVVSVRIHNAHSGVFVRYEN